MTALAPRFAALLAVVVLGCTHPLPAEATFSSNATASPAVAAHTLAVPVLGCSGGGLLSGTVTLTWPQVSSAATADPYASPPNSTYLASGYEIHRSANGGPYALLLSPGRTATSATNDISGVGNTYSYKIRTMKGTWSSPFSNVVTASVTSILFVGTSTNCPA